MMSRWRPGKLILAKLTKRTAVLVGALCVLAAVVNVLAYEPPAWLEGRLFDSALLARSKLLSEEERHPSPRVAVIALDAQSLNDPALLKYPRALFAPIWADMVDKVSAAGADVIAFDFIFSYSGHDFQRNFDLPLLKSLARNRSKIVLARSSKILPDRRIFAALRNDSGTLGTIEVSPDNDEIFRTVRSNYMTEAGDGLPTLAGAVLSRAGVKELPSEIVFAPPIKSEVYIPTFAIADILRCGEVNPQALEGVFKNRVVFVGTTLPGEDRKTASDRFLLKVPPAHIAETECNLRTLGASVPDPNVEDIPGVYLSAVATDHVLRNNQVRPVPVTIAAIVTAIAAAVGAVIGFRLPPIFAIVALITAISVLVGGQVGALIAGHWLPTANSVLAVIIAAVIAYVVRYVLEERRRNRVQTAFGHYLAPSLVHNLVDSEDDLELGGRSCDVTIMFADLSGFTALSEKVGPEELVARTNEYLKLIADEVEATGGYVDKFIGDAVMAMWGAPVDLPEHALAATNAAMRIGEQVDARRTAAAAKGEHGFSIKIGLNTGAAVVGNVGSESRFNYTAVGEAVNIAARLEGLPGVYNNTIIVGPETAARIRDHYILREIDQVTVKGKVEPLKIFEPVVKKDAAAPSNVEAYLDALNRYRNKQFDAAAKAWEALGDGPSLVMAERARAFIETPPPDAWNGVWVMTTK